MPSPLSCRYVSTRDAANAPKECSFEEAVLTGIADDGGLFVPRALPVLSAETLRSWAHLTFPELAYEVVSLFIAEDDVPRAELRAMLKRAFSVFSSPEVVPVVPVGSVRIAELWHGPTLAFKDIGMQFVAQLLDFYLLRRKQRVSIVVSTSGDTGPAAIHATKGKAAIDSFVLFPRGLVSRRQALQMTTVPDRNVHVYEVEGATSDDLDVVVKNLNSDLAFKREHALLSINSFNWARVLSQAVHFFFAYLRVCPKVDGPVVFSVPTGAMGDGMAAFVARKMGLPIDRIILATNENDVIAKFFETGIYLKPPTLKPTISPAIDIQVPYNLERLLYFCSDSAQSVLGWMTEFERTGRVSVSASTMAVAREAISAVMVDQRQTFEAIKSCWALERYVLDPHTAVGVSGAEKICGMRAFGPSKSWFPLPVICLATAHCSKFESVTADATGADRDVPDSIRRLESPRAGYHAKLVDVRNRVTGKLDRVAFDSFETALKRDISESFRQLRAKL